MSLNEVARLAVKKHEDHFNFFVVLISMCCAVQTKVLCSLFVEQI